VPLPLKLQAGGQETVLRVYMSSPIGGVFADITPDLISQHRQVRFRQLHMAFCRGYEVMQTINSKCSAPAGRLEVDLYLLICSPAAGTPTMGLCTAAAVLQPSLEHRPVAINKWNGVAAAGWGKRGPLLGEGAAAAEYGDRGAAKP